MLVRVCAFVWLGSLAVVNQAAQDWSASPEAYFLTRQEQQEWKKLHADDDREHFKTLYWHRRDPTPQTERNEFQELVLARIRTADTRFPIGKTPGSRTGRGVAFIVLGPPATERQTIGPLKTAPQMIAPGRMSIPSEAFETTEWHTWVYDRETAADLLAVLRVPSLEIAFIVEPGRRDEIQNASRFERWKEILARHSIVNGAVP